MVGFAVRPATARPRRDAASAPRTAAVIPARYASTRLPAKPLADIGGRTLVEHVYRHAADARSVDLVLVATDDERIARAVAAFGGQVRMTRPDHATGTDRLAEVAETLDCDLVVNVQGDEPLIRPQTIDAAVAAAADPEAAMSTLRCPLRDAAAWRDPDVVKVAVDRRGYALFFSRAPIGLDRDAPAEARIADPDAPAEARIAVDRHIPARSASPPRPAPPSTEARIADPDTPAEARISVDRHIGLYVYRRPFLLTLSRLEPTPLERAERLEQLRALEHGYRIMTTRIDDDPIGVDTPADLERVRRRLAAGAPA